MLQSESENDSNFISFQRDNLDKSPQDIRAYWTPERKQNAVPTPIDTMPALAEPPDAANAEPATDPKQADLSKMPFTAAGKLFYTIDGKDFVASGNIFVQRNMLLTAAHCIQNKQTGALAENFVFERCYTGELSSEDFTFKTVVLKENWYLKKNVAFDYAIAILNRSSDVAEPLRYSIDPNIEGKRVTSLGYPTAYFDGAQMMMTESTVKAKDNHWIMPGSKMGPGSSGGAWVLDDNMTVVGLNAYVVRSGKEIQYSGSPKLDKEFDSMYKYALTLI